MKTKRFHIFAALFLAGLFSCNKNLLEYNPSGTTANTVWSTPQGFITNVNGCYSYIPFLYGNDENGLFLSEPGTDIWYNYNKTAYDVDLTQYQNFNSGSNPCKGVWTTLYAALNLCNAGIGRIGNAGFTNPVEMNMRLAELKLIFSDLKFAIANLPDVSGANTNVSSKTWEFGRATKPAALALMARASLSYAYYQGGGQTYFQQAHDYADSIILNQSLYNVSLYTNYADMWAPANRLGNSSAKANQESIFCATFSTNTTLDINGNGNRTNLWFLTNYSGYTGTAIPGLTLSIQYGNDQKNRRFMPTRALLDFYNDTIDARYAATFQEIWLCNKAYTWTEADYCVLTKTGLTTYPGYLDNIVFRLAEEYLVAAEADFQLGNLNDAAAMINVLRTRAAKKTPVDYTSAMQVTSSQITLDFILDERAREMCGEYSRWFDLKRTSKLASRIAAYNPDITAFNNDFYLRPVPLAELQALTNGAQFGQNPGY